jgi:hypothetical protein
MRDLEKTLENHKTLPCGEKFPTLGMIDLIQRKF